MSRVVVLKEFDTEEKVLNIAKINVYRECTLT